MKRLAFNLLFLSIVWFSITTSLAHAAPQATLTVTNLNDTGTGSLRAQIAAANSGDTIDFSVSGTIVLASELVHKGVSKGYICEVG